MLWFVGSFSLYAQRIGDGRQVPPKMQSVWFEPVPLLGNDTTKAFVSLHYRIGGDFFIFVKSPDNSKRDEYVARGELIVEFLDEQNVSNAREIRPINLRQNSLSANGGATSQIQGAIPFSLKEGEYRILLEVKDLESGRSFLDRDRKVKVTSPHFHTLEASTPFFAQMSVQDSGKSTPKFIPFNRGVDPIFGGSGGYLMHVYLPRNEDLFSLTWKIQEMREDHSRELQEISGNQYVMLPGALELAASEKEVQYGVKQSQLPWKVIYVPMPLEKMEPGSFEIELTMKAGDASNIIKRTFRIVWPSKPLSLSNFDVAVDALRHIASETEIDEMTGFAANRGMEKFREFWRKRDPDTTTAYNEVMAEYYRRVDEVIRRYSTSDQLDGYKTDRGRIFILFGSPTRTERVFRPNSAPRELWIYEQMKKKFVFTDPNRTGTYILTQTETL